MKKISSLLLVAALSVFSLVASAKDTTVKAIVVKFDPGFAFI